MFCFVYRLFCGDITSSPDPISLEKQDMNSWLWSFNLPFPPFYYLPTINSSLTEQKITSKSNDENLTLDLSIKRKRSLSSSRSSSFSPEIPQQSILLNNCHDYLYQGNKYVYKLFYNMCSITFLYMMNSYF